MNRWTWTVTVALLFSLTQVGVLGVTPVRAATDCMPRANQHCRDEGKDLRKPYVAIEVEGQLLNLYPAAFEENGYVMGPMRAIFEALGATVTWNERERSETATLGSHTVKVWMGSRTYTVDGVKKQLGIAPRLVGDVVMAPVRAVGEALGAIVQWDEAGRLERIYTPKAAPAVNAVDLVIEGQKTNLTPKAFVENGVLMGPMRAVFEALGAEVNWNEAEQSETAIFGDNWVKVWIGRRSYLENGTPRQLPVAPRLMGGIVVVPLKQLAEKWSDVPNAAPGDTVEIELDRMPWVQRPVNLMINGVRAYLSPGAFEEGPDGYVMAPMQAVLERLGAKVTRNKQEGSMTATVNGRSIKVFKGSYRAFASGAAWDLPVRPREIQGQLFVPIRRVAQALGASVTWDEVTRVETITLAEQPDDYQEPVVLHGPHGIVSDGDMRVIQTTWELDRDKLTGRGKLFDFDDANVDMGSLLVTDVAPEFLSLLERTAVGEAAKLASKGLKVFTWLEILGELLLKRPEPVHAQYKRVVLELQAQVYEGGRWRTLAVSQGIRYVLVIPNEDALKVLSNGHVLDFSGDVAIVDHPHAAPAHFDPDVLLKEAAERYRRGYAFVCESWSAPTGCFDRGRFDTSIQRSYWIY